ncbi:MAG: zinc ribbon domain-containing protein [Chloroflexi bacterium]|nr:zinc ribbon domain-containing protein [Chloroflexota bacterium]
MGKNTDVLLSQEFVCPKCHQQGAHVKRLSMSGTGLSRLFEMQLNRYAFVSCHNCGYTEVYNLEVLEGRDNLGSLLELLFSN